MKLRATVIVKLVVKILIVLIIQLINGCLHEKSFQGRAYAYSPVDSCYYKIMVLIAPEKYANDFSEWYANGFFDHPDSADLAIYRTLTVEFSAPVDIIRFAVDSAYAKVRFPNPLRNKYRNAFKDRYREGFVPINLLHKDSIPPSKDCSEN